MVKAQTLSVLCLFFCSFAQLEGKYPTTWNGSLLTMCMVFGTFWLSNYTLVIHLLSHYRDSLVHAFSSVVGHSIIPSTLILALYFTRISGSNSIDPHHHICTSTCTDICRHFLCSQSCIIFSQTHSLIWTLGPVSWTHNIFTLFFSQQLNVRAVTLR